MKKSDLKTGMKVTLRNGYECIVLRNFAYEFPSDIDVLISINTNHYWFSFDSYNDDLSYDGYNDDLSQQDPQGNEYDIVKVESPDHALLVFDTIQKSNPKYGFKGHKWNLEWKRDQTTYTIDGVEYSESSLRSLIKKATQ